jgi:hypothetical protein
LNVIRRGNRQSGALTRPCLFEEGELRVVVDGVPIIDRIFVNEAEGEFIVAQWKLLAATFSITEKTDGRKLANALRKLVVTETSALVQQIITLEADLSELERDIRRREKEMNELVNSLYGLTDAEVLVVVRG